MQLLTVSINKLIKYESLLSNESAVIVNLTKIVCSSNPADIYLFKVNNGNTRTKYEICSKLTIKTPEQRLASSLLTLIGDTSTVCVFDRSNTYI